MCQHIKSFSENTFRSINSSSFFRYASLVAALSISIGWFYFTYRFSVNILFSDAWDFHRNFIQVQTVFQQFVSQFGPQRQGLGLVITGWLNDLSGWNSNWVSMGIAVLFFASAVVYLQIKRKLFGNLNPFDLSIVIVVLSLNQFEVLTITPFMSHSAIPALFVSLYCLSFFIKGMLARHAALIIINLNLVFSSFGFFMGTITVIYFTFLLIKSFGNSAKKQAWANLISLMFALTTLLIFFIDYDLGYAKNHTSFLWNEPWQYLFYMSLSYAGLFGLKGVGLLQIIFGLFVLSVLVFILVKALVKIIPSKAVWNKGLISYYVIAVLIAYSLIFAVNLSFGRIELGLEYAGSSRYLPYLVPSLIGAYYYLNTLRISGKMNLIPVFFTFMIIVQLTSLRATQDMKAWWEMKSRWKKYYLETENPYMADSLSNFKLHPDNESILEVLDYLKENRLNMFREKAMPEQENSTSN